MALQFVDGFETFGGVGTANGTNDKWVISGSHNNTTILTGRFGGLAIQMRNTSSGGIGLRTPVFSAQSTMVAGVAFRMSALPSTSSGPREIMSFHSGTTTPECGVAVTPDGGIRVFRGDASTSIQDSTSTGLIQPNKWYYIEFKATIANSGSFDVYLDGVQVAFSSNSGDTQSSNANCTNVFLRGRSNDLAFLDNVQHDDFYCLTTTGAPDDFLGPQHVKTIFPDATGDSAQFTPSAGDNYAAVDDNPNDGDTTYVESSTTGHKDLYNFGSVGTFSNINAAVVYGIAKKTDVSSFTFIAVAKSNGTEADGASQLVDTTSFDAFGGVFLVDPDTTTAWTDTAITAAQFGYKIG